MKIHEYQAKKILDKFGVQIPRGEVADTPSKAREITEKIGPKVVLKAQVHAGGRGKGGGIRLASNPEEAEEIAQEMIGMTLVTHQTGPEGKLVKRILVEEALDIAQELYLGIVIDRANEEPVVMASSEGGVEIEKVADMRKIIVQKYGGSSVGTPKRIKNVAGRIVSYKKRGYNIVVVVSARGDATDELLASARRITKSPSSREMLLLDQIGG